MTNTILLYLLKHKNKKSELNKMLERNSIKYDENDVITFTKEQITSLKDKNIIYDIIRN